MNIKSYELSLPLFKQGDDFDFYLSENNDDPIQSLRDLSSQYKDAADICDMVATVLDEAKDNSNISARGATHMIYFEAPENIVASLLEKNILQPNKLDEMEGEEG